MQIGLTAYDIEPLELLHLAAAADEAGFSSLWLGEHVVLPVGYASEHPTTAHPRSAAPHRPDRQRRHRARRPLVQLGAPP